MIIVYLLSLDSPVYTLALCHYTVHTHIVYLIDDNYLLFHSFCGLDCMF